MLLLLMACRHTWRVIVRRWRYASPDAVAAYYLRATFMLLRAAYA